MNNKNIHMGVSESKKIKLEIVNTVILSIATLLITWCSYQSILWGGIQTFKLADANGFNRRAQEATLIAEQHKAIDADIIAVFVDAVWERQKAKVDFYLHRVRPELSVILKDWVELHPLENRTAPPHPLAMDAYKTILQRESIRINNMRKNADLSMHEAQKANIISDNYSLYTVVFSMVLFLGAIAGKTVNDRISLILNVVAGIICIMGICFLFLKMPLAS